VWSIRKVRYKERDTLRVPILLPPNIPTAIVCTTLTTVSLGGKPRVIAEFFAFLNIAFGNNPDGASGVIDGAGFVFEGLAIDIIAVIEGKDVLVALI
jgi:hypothetical protein